MGDLTSLLKVEKRRFEALEEILPEVSTDTGGGGGTPISNRIQPYFVIAENERKGCNHCD